MLMFSHAISCLTTSNLTWFMDPTFQCVHGTFCRRSPLSSLPPLNFGLRSNNREGTQPRPSTENWIKYLLRMALPIITWPSFSLSQSLPSVHFSLLVMSDSLQPHGLQQARLPCPSPIPGAYSNSCPSSWWCHPTISSSVVPFSSHLQSFPASGSFQMSQVVTSGGQSIGVSASASALPMNIQDWFPLGWTGWISLQSKGLSRVFSNTTVQKHQFFGALPSGSFHKLRILIH